MQVNLARGFEALLFGLFLLVLFWAPLPFGSNRPWAAALLFLLLSFLCVAWLLLCCAGAAGLPRLAWRRGRWPLLILSFVPLWIFVQTLPLPGGLVSFISPRAAFLHGVSGPLPISLDVAATRLYLLKSLSCLCAFILVLGLVSSARRAEILLWTLVLSGVFQATYGVLMVLSGLELGFFVEKYTGHGVATGTFVNRNHLAGYLVMTLAAGTGLLVARLSESSPATLRQRIRDTLRLLLSRKIILRVMLALMVIALVMTRSRMGNLAFFAALGVAGVVAVYCGRRLSRALIVLLISLFVVDAVIVGQWFGFDKVVERLGETAPDTQQRLTLSARSSSILADFPLTGSGGGSFYSVFTFYKDVGSTGDYEHAHNDYLELASDLGIPALLLLGVVLVMALARAFRLQGRDHSRLQRGTGFTLVVVITWVVLHSAVDFNLQIPANSATVCALLALAFASLRDSAQHRSSARE